MKTGIVDLDGNMVHDHERTALKALTENTPGVKAVRDHLVWIEPLSGTVLPSEDSPPTII